MAMLTCQSESLTKPRPVKQESCAVAGRLEKEHGSMSILSQPMVTARDSCFCGSPFTFFLILSHHSVCRETNAQQPDVLYAEYENAIRRCKDDL